MAHVVKLPDGTYKACWRDRLGHQRSKNTGLTRKADAERAAAVKEEAARSRLPAVEMPGDHRGLTWSTWCGQWQPLRSVEESTEAADQARIEKWIKPYWGQALLDVITAQDVQAWANTLRKLRDPKDRDQPLLMPRTVIRIYKTFATSMSAAVAYRKLLVNPCVGIVLPTAADIERFMTLEEFQAVAELLDDPYLTLAVLLVSTGMRFGEVAGMHWSQVDRENGVIWASNVLTPGRKIKPYPKGRKGRPVPILDWVVPYLGEAPAYLRGATCGLPHLYGAACPGPLVLYGPRGGVLDHRTIRDRHWIPAVDKARVPDGRGGRRALEPFRLHDLRHTAAMAILGHASLKTTEKYAHFGSTHLGGVRGAMSAYNPFAASSTARTAQASGEVIELASRQHASV